MMKDRCGRRITVSEHDIVFLQQKMLLGESKEEVGEIWQEICDHCPLVDDFSRSTALKNVTEKFEFNDALKNTPTRDICVAFAPNGEAIAR